MKKICFLILFLLPLFSKAVVITYFGEVVPNYVRKKLAFVVSIYDKEYHLPYDTLNVFYRPDSSIESEDGFVEAYSDYAKVTFLCGFEVMERVMAHELFHTCHKGRFELKNPFVLKDGGTMSYFKGLNVGVKFPNKDVFFTFFEEGAAEACAHLLFEKYTMKYHVRSLNYALLGSFTLKMVFSEFFTPNDLINAAKENDLGQIVAKILGKTVPGNIDFEYLMRIYNNVGIQSLDVDEAIYLLKSKRERKWLFWEADLASFFNE